MTVFTGYMLGNLPLEKSGLISKEHVCEGEEFCASKPVASTDTLDLCVTCRIAHVQCVLHMLYIMHK